MLKLQLKHYLNFMTSLSIQDSQKSPKKQVESSHRSNIVAGDDPFGELFKNLYELYHKPVELVWDAIKVGILDVQALFFITYSDVNEIISGEKCLNISILQLWMM